MYTTVLQTKAHGATQEKQCSGYKFAHYINSYNPEATKIKVITDVCTGEDETQVYREINGISSLRYFDFSYEVVLMILLIEVFKQNIQDVLLQCSNSVILITK